MLTDRSTAVSRLRWACTCRTSDLRSAGLSSGLSSSTACTGTRTPLRPILITGTPTALKILHT